MFFCKKKKLEKSQNTAIYPPAFNDDPPSLQITSDYEDNKIFPESYISPYRPTIGVNL